MTSGEALIRIKRAIECAPEKNYIAEMHLQIIKYAADLQGITGREFCKVIGIGKSFGTEYSKMRKISGRLIAAGLDVDKL